MIACGGSVVAMMCVLLKNPTNSNIVTGDLLKGSDVVENSVSPSVQ